MHLMYNKAWFLEGLTMFENYDTNNLYKATIVDYGSIISMENVGGCFTFMSDIEPTY